MNRNCLKSMLKSGMHSNSGTHFKLGACSESTRNNKNLPPVPLLPPPFPNATCFLFY